MIPETRSQSLQNSVFEFSTNPLEVSEDITAAHTESSSYISIKTFQKSDSGKYARTNFSGSLSDVVTIAHELGHAILHPKSNTPFLRANTLYSVNKLETEANRFMALLLHPATEIQDYAQCGYTLYQIADICGLTPELVEYIITTYNRNDAASS